MVALFLFYYIILDFQQGSCYGSVKLFAIAKLLQVNFPLVNIHFS